MRRKFLVCLVSLMTLVLVVGLSFSCTAQAPGQPTAAPPVSAPAKTFEWKFQSHWPAASLSYAPFKKFCEEEILKLTDGRLKITVYPADTFMPTKDMFEAWRTNALQGGTGSVYWTSIVPLQAVSGNCPFAFRDAWEVQYFHVQLGFEDALKKVHEAAGVMYWTEKWYPTAMISKKPVKTLTDLKGLKVRSSGTIADMLKEVGAAPTMIPGAEIYTALQTGVVDAAHWGAAGGAYTMKFYEVAKYYVQPNLAFCATDWVAISKKAWDELPKDLQLIVDLALRERAWDRSNEYYMEEMDALNTMVTKHGVQVITLDADAQKALQAAALKVWDRVAAASADNAHWVGVMKDFMRKLGYLQ